MIGERAAEVTVFIPEGHQPRERRVNIAMIPLEERASLLFAAGMPIHDIAEDERCSAADIEAALRAMLNACGEQLSGFRSDLELCVERLYDEHSRLACRDHPRKPDDIEFHKERGACDAYYQAAQDVQDVLNHRRRPTKQRALDED